MKKSKFGANIVLYAAAFLAFGFAGNAEAALTEPYGIAQPACIAPVIRDFTPYIYDGELHSFEYTVVGGEVAIPVSTVVGERTIEPRYSTQRRGVNTARVHVDVPGWYGFFGETPIALRVAGPDPRCGAEAQLSVMLRSSGKPPASSGAVTPAVVPDLEALAPETPTDVNVLDEMGSDAGVLPGAGRAEEVESPDASLTRAMIASIGTFFNGKEEGKQCSTLSRSNWIALLIVAIVALLIVIDRLPYLLRGSGVKFAVTLLAVFAFSLGLWFVFDRCRLVRWFPVSITILTLLTLLTPTMLDPKKLRSRK